MADLMQQARGLLAAEIGAPVTAGSFVGTLPAGVHSDAAIRAIAAALRAAPEGFVLVPSDSVVPCGCGCHRHCCRHCGYELGGLAARQQGVKDAR